MRESNVGHGRGGEQTNPYLSQLNRPVSAVGRFVSLRGRMDPEATSDKTPSSVMVPRIELAG
jgi:hypothetical protein